MVYTCGCDVVGRPSHFTTSVEMRFFWLPLSTMNCIREPFTHICEWNRCSPSFGSLGSIFQILIVATVVLGPASMIRFPLAFPLWVFSSKLEHVSDSEAFNLATNDCLARHSLVLWVELLWNSHHFPTSFFVFVALFFACSFNGLSYVAPPWLFPLLCNLGAPFPCFGFADPKSPFFLFKLPLNIDSVLVRCAEWGDVQELHLILDVPM